MMGYAKKTAYWTSVFLMLSVIFMPLTTSAISPAQRSLYNGGQGLYDLEVGSTTSEGQSCELGGSDNREKVWNFFISKDYSPEQVAGIIGNMATESGVEPMRLQGKPAGTKVTARSVEGRTGIGWGLVQWTPPGKMIVPSRAEGASYEEIDTVEHQVDFLWRQLEGTAPDANEQAAGTHLKQQTTVEGATRSFMVKYERPKDQSESAIQHRVPAAQAAFTEFGSNTGGGGCAGSGDWQWPYKADQATTITSCYGVRFHPIHRRPILHAGIDIATSQGTALVAAKGGQVEHAGVLGGYGNTAVIDHGDGETSLYAHMVSSPSVNVGDQVKAGDTIGQEGMSGAVTGVHLHFEIRSDDNPLNPLSKISVPGNANNSRHNCSTD